MKLTDTQVKKLLEPIHAARIKARDGFDYVETHDIRAMMIRIFGFAGWSLVETSPPVLLFEAETQLKSGKSGYHVAYRAHLAIVVHTDDGDVTYAGSAVADSQMPDYKRADAHDMALKSAESGAFKRAATNLGDQFGLSLYSDKPRDAYVRRLFTSEGDAAPASPTAGAPPVGAGDEAPSATPDPPPGSRNLVAFLDGNERKSSVVRALATKFPKVNVYAVEPDKVEAVQAEIDVMLEELPL